MAGVAPRFAEDANLASLLHMKRLARLVFLERRALHVHAVLRGPDRGRVGTRAPPDAVAQSLRVRLETQQSRRIGKHRPRIGLREPFSLQQLEKLLGVTASHVGVAGAGVRCIAEVAPPFDDLFRRAATDPELKPPVADQVRRARVLYHIEGVLVPHVDDGGADLDAARLGADGGEEREGRCELPREVMDAKIRAVGAELLGRYRELDRLLENVACGTRGGLARRAPMAEREKADLLHECRNGGSLDCNASTRLPGERSSATYDSVPVQEGVMEVKRDSGMMRSRTRY